MFSFSKKNTTKKPNNLANNNKNNISLNNYIKSIESAENINKKLSDHKDYMLNTYGQRLVDKAVKNNEVSVLDWCITNNFPYSESTIMLALEKGNKDFLEKLYDEAVKRNKKAIGKSYAVFSFSFGKRNLNPNLIINNSHKDGNFLIRLLKKCIEYYDSDKDKSNKNKYEACLDWIIQKYYGTNKTNKTKKTIKNLNSIKNQIGYQKK